MKFYEVLILVCFPPLLVIGLVSFVVLKRRGVLMLALLLLVSGLHPASATPDTLQSRIDTFIATLHANPWAYANEPPAVFTDAETGAIVYVSPVGAGGQITMPPDVPLSGHIKLTLFHPPFYGNREAASPPAPQDLAMAAYYEVDSITAIGYDPIANRATFDTMSDTRLYWPDLITNNWVDRATAAIARDAATRRGSWTARENAALRAYYATLRPDWLKYSFKDIQ